MNKKLIEFNLDVTEQRNRFAKFIRSLQDYNVNFAITQDSNMIAIEIL